MTWLCAGDETRPNCPGPPCGSRTRRIFPDPDREPRAFRARLFESWTETGSHPRWGQKKGSFMLQAARLPSPTVDVWAWQQLASCRGAVSSIFFGREGESRRARIARERVAKDLCSRCEVIAECRDHALTVGEPYGIWGGLSATERQTLAGR